MGERKVFKIKCKPSEYDVYYHDLPLTWKDNSICGICERKLKFRRKIGEKYGFIAQCKKCKVFYTMTITRVDIGMFDIK